ncbi:glycosyltransferase family 4 protein [Fulvivirga sp. 29W222]|uniref:Glycosyltransferase family 4 protein n=1 Tax=Fulvivirga marina TaxID=2494733 RepID=A0A937FZ59_9BACT|nr:glycosyltransferase family 4 protein [Fulvivirga marina]MBL6448854.1 glycosyltransferase family 4 protein [Fulvivirga marina]
MKVLMFGWEFPPHISGGLGTACYGIVTGLLREEVEVIFVIPKLYGDENSEAFRLVSASDVLINTNKPVTRKWSERLQYIEAQSPLAPYTSFDQPEVKCTETVEIRETEVMEKYPLQRFEMTGKYGTELMQEVHKYAVVASEIASTYNFDIIHVHDWLTFPAGIAASEASGKPLIAHIHATEYDRSGININQAVFDIEKEGMQQADHVIAVSDYTRKIIIDKYEIDPNKVSVIHNGISSKDNEAVHSSKGIQEKVVTFMGRITYQKGPEYFVEAARKVLDVIPNVRFVMAGGGDLMNTMIERVAELKMSSRFHFTGFLNGSEVDKMYGMSDVFVMPSVSEPFGIAPLEAIKANVPVIISKQSGVSEVLKNAIKVDFWDVDALADAIAALLQYNSLSGLFRDHGKNDIKVLNWQRSASVIKEVYIRQLKSSSPEISR